MMYQVCQKDRTVINNKGETVSRPVLETHRSLRRAKLAAQDWMESTPGVTFYVDNDYNGRVHGVYLFHKTV